MTTRDGLAVLGPCGAAELRVHAAGRLPDPDVLMAGSEVERRADIAACVGALPGNARATGDRLGELDDWGIAATRKLLSEGS